MSKVGVVDYGCGNLASLAACLRRLRIKAVVSSSADELGRCDKLILPGVGSFPYAMQKLEELDLVSFIHQRSDEGVPILGICLGMQLLFDESAEFGGAKGLGLLKGEVIRLPEVFPTIPNTGWWDLTLHQGEQPNYIKSSDAFYFVHSYYCKPRLVDTAININFAGADICAMVVRQHITAVQFHPEKSQLSGERLISNFVSG